MIVLKHLSVERFRLLRSVNLHFPQRGSILIQGPNASGQSALLESIYFALYGESFTSERDKYSLDDLIQHSAARAAVTLSLAIGTTNLTITRTIERNKGQRVRLYVQQPDRGSIAAPQVTEPITQLEAANDRIITELGHIDGETLRNSFLIEQKGLARLESLSRVEYEAVIRRLLGLEKLTHLTEGFKVTLHDEQRLKEYSEHLRLAEVQARISELSGELDRLEAALDAGSVYEHLESVKQQEVEITEQDVALERLQARRVELKGALGRVQQLKKVDAILGDIITAYDALTGARQRTPELEKQLAELDRRERKELPALEKRVNDLVDLAQLFGTLQRMSNDLLTSVDTIKELEQDLKQHSALHDSLKHIGEQIANTQSRAAQVQQRLHDLEEQRRAERPILEARLLHLKTVKERLAVLHELEEQYTRRITSKGLTEENEAQLQKILEELDETEQEQASVENEAKQAPEQAEALEKRWHQLSIREQLEEWLRLKSLSQGFAQAEQQVRMAHQHQEQLTVAALDARRSATKYMGLVATCGVLFLLSAGAAIVEAIKREPSFAAFAGVAVVFLAAGVGWGFRYYRKAHARELVANRQMQDAISRVRMMVTAREAASRVGNTDAIHRVPTIEHEIRSLGGNVPSSLEEAQRLVAQIQDAGDSLADIQKQMQEKRDEANAARDQLHVMMEAAATLRKERARLEEQRKREGWDNVEENLRSTQAAIERMHQEITLLAAQEGLPLLSINARLQGFIPQDTLPFGAIPPPLDDEGLTDVPELDALVESTIQASEREIAALDDKQDMAADLKAQLKTYQNELDELLTRERQIQEVTVKYETNSPIQQIEQAREQQTALRNAVQSLQESLHQRVKPLGVAFGQTAIASAEAAARKQLEELHILLAGKMTLQEHHTACITLLKERQELLAEYYKQLAKFSNTLGTWVVPPNPFPDALSALRLRCQDELQEVGEANILREIDRLQAQEGACRAKIELCRQELHEAHERIATLLVQHNRPIPQAGAVNQTPTFSDIVAAWPLLADAINRVPTEQDYTRLESEYEALEKELEELEKQELAMSTSLQTGGVTLDLEQAHVLMNQQERSYQAKKWGNQLVKAVNKRLMRKMIPRTEYYMQQILSLLTGGRYHDVYLTNEPEVDTVSEVDAVSEANVTRQMDAIHQVDGVNEADAIHRVPTGGSLQLHVWDSAAGEYVAKSALSAAAADQLSLALRLAFAIAALPRELNAAPGFLLLDERLISFDRDNVQALVDVLTGDILNQHFEQILLISHNNAFAPAMFPYHVYIDNGLIVESNLPLVVTAPLAEIDDKEEDLALRVAAVPL